MINNDVDITEFKEAIVSCARDEVRKLIGEIVLPNGPESTTDSSFFATGKTPERSRRHNGSRTLLRQRTSNKSFSDRKTRPKTACTFSSPAIRAYKPRRIKSCSKIKCRHGKVILSSQDESDESGGPVPFASARWIEKSAQMIEKSVKEVCNMEPTKTGHIERRLNLDTETHQEGKNRAALETSNFEDPRLKRSKASMPSRIIRRPLSRPSTALERRAPTRPSTAHIVRAKAEGFSRNLLRPIDLTSSKEFVDPLPFSMRENQWENELARHIVTVYNNKIISEVRDSQGTNPVEKFTNEFQDGPSKRTKQLASSLSSSKLNGMENGYRPQTTHARNEKIIRQTKQLIKGTTPRMVWFGGTGDAPLRWDNVEEIARLDPDILPKLQGKGNYAQYITIIKSEICAVMHTLTQEDEKELLWRRLVIMANSFISILIAEKKYPKAIEMLEIASDLLSTDYIQSNDCLQELRGLLKDSHAHYYSKRGKPSAALQYIIGATNIEKQRVTARKERQGQQKTPFTIQLARCHLHRAYILQHLNRFNEAMKYMKQVLVMVDSHLMHYDQSKVSVNNDHQSKSVISDSDPQIIVLVAVTYHNIAVIQILMGHIGDACINSQNCRRLCRLCMSVSSCYVPQFEETHMKALCELSNMLRSKQTNEEALVFQKLVVELFD